MSMLLERYTVHTLFQNRVQCPKMAAIIEIKLFLIDYYSFCLYLLGQHELSVVTVATCQWLFKHIFRAHFLSDDVYRLCKTA